MEAQSLTFALHDVSAGYEATPERVRLESLTEFASDVSLANAPLPATQTASR